MGLCRIFFLFWEFATPTYQLNTDLMSYLTVFREAIGTGEREKGKSTKCKGLAGVLGKTKADDAEPVDCGVPVPV